MSMDGPTLVRALHFVSPQLHGDEGVLACREVLACRDLSHRVCVVGTRADAERVKRLGVCVDGIIPVAQRAGLMDRGLRRVVGLLAEELPGEWAACSWGVELATLGRAAYRLGAAGQVVVETRGPAAVRGAVDDDVVRRRGSWPGLEHAVFVGAGEVVAREWDRAGAKDVRTAPLAFAHAGIERGARRTGVAGVEGVTEEAGGSPHVIGLLAAPASMGDARQFVFVLGLLYAAGLRMHGLVPTGALNARRAARFVRDHGRRWGLREWTGPVHELASVCDALVCPASTSEDERLTAGPAVLAAASNAGRAGLPIITHDCQQARELAASGYELVIARDSRSVTLAARLLDCLTPGRGVEAVANAGIGASERRDVGDSFSFGRVVADVILESAGMGPRVAEIEAMPSAGRPHAGWKPAPQYCGRRGLLPDTL